jgi:hypothetical protein
MTRKMPTEAPTTYLVDVDFARVTLSHREMVALSGAFRRWALYDPIITPEWATELIKYSCDLEQIAEWVGPSWKPEGTCNCEERLPFIKFIAQMELQHSQVIPFNFRRQ